MNKELIEALNVLEKEKDISKEVILEAIENSLLTAYKVHFGKCDNVTISIDHQTGDYKILAEKEVVEIVEDKATCKRRSKVKGIWQNCNTECKEYHYTEDQGRGKKSTL